MAKPGLNYEILVDLLAKLDNVQVDSEQYTKEIQKALLAFAPKQFIQEVPVELRPDVKLTTRQMREAQRQVFSVFSELQHAFPSTEIPTSDALANIIKGAGIKGEAEIKKLQTQFESLSKKRTSDPEKFTNLAETLSRVNALDLDALDKLESAAGRKLVSKARSGAKLTPDEKIKLSELEAIATTFGKQLTEATQPLKSTKTKALKATRIGDGDNGYDEITRSGKNAPAIITTGLDKVTKSVASLGKVTEEVERKAKVRAKDAERADRRRAISGLRKDFDSASQSSNKAALGSALTAALQKERSSLRSLLSDDYAGIGTDVPRRRLKKQLADAEQQLTQLGRSKDQWHPKEITQAIEKGERDRLKAQEKLAEEEKADRTRLAKDEAKRLKANSNRDLVNRAVRGEDLPLQELRNAQALLRKDLTDLRQKRDIVGQRQGFDSPAAQALDDRYREAAQSLDTLKQRTDEAARAERRKTAAISQEATASAERIEEEKRRRREEEHYRDLIKQMNTKGRNSLSEADRTTLGQYLERQEKAALARNMRAFDIDSPLERSAELDRSRQMVDELKMLRKDLRDGTPIDYKDADDRRFRNELNKQRSLLDAARSGSGNDWVLGVPAEQWKSTVSELRRESRELTELLNAKGADGKKIGSQEQRNLAGARIVDNERDIARLTRAHGDFNEKLSQSTLLLRQFFRYAIGYGALYSMLAGVTALVRGLVDLDKTLYSIKAIGNLTAKEMESVQAAIERTALATKFTVSEIGQATQVLVQAGVAQNEINSALQGTALFASATGSDLALAADLVTTYRNVFKDLDDLDIANQLTSAINLSKLSAEDLKTILSISAQVSESYNLTSDKYLAAVTTLRNAGLKASTVATGLRQGLFELFNPDNATLKALKQRYQEVGNVLGDATTDQIRAHFFKLSLGDNPLVSVLRELGSLGFTGSGKETLGRAYDIRAFNAISALINNLGELESNEISIAFSNSAAKASATQMESLAASLDNLGAAITTFAAAVSSDLVRGLEDAADAITDVVRNMKTLHDQLKATTGSGLEKVAGNSVLGAVAGAAVGKTWKSRIGLATLGAYGGGKATAATDDPGFQDLISVILSTLGLGSLLKGTGKAAVGGISAKGAGLAEAGLIAGKSSKLGALLTKAGGLGARFLSGPIGWIVSIGSALALVIEGMEAFDKAVNKDTLDEKLEGSASLLEGAHAKVKALKDQADKYDNFTDLPDGGVSGSPDNLVVQLEALRRDLEGVNETTSRWFGEASSHTQSLLDRLAASSGDLRDPEIKDIVRQLNDASLAPIAGGNGSDDNIRALKTLADNRARVNQSIANVANEVVRKNEALSTMSEQQIAEIASGKQVLEAFEGSTRRLDRDIRAAIHAGVVKGKEEQTLDFLNDFYRSVANARQAAVRQAMEDANSQLMLEIDNLAESLTVDSDASSIRRFATQFEGSVLPVLAQLGATPELVVNLLKDKLEVAKYALEQEIEKERNKYDFAIKELSDFETKAAETPDSDGNQKSLDVNKRKTLQGKVDRAFDRLKNSEERLQSRLTSLNLAIEEGIGSISTSIAATKLKQVDDNVKTEGTVRSAITTLKGASKAEGPEREGLFQALSDSLDEDGLSVKQVLKEFGDGLDPNLSQPLHTLFLTMEDGILKTTDKFETLAKALKLYQARIDGADKNAELHAAEDRAETLRAELEALKNRLDRERRDNPTEVAYSDLPKQIGEKQREVIEADKVALYEKAKLDGDLGERKYHKKQDRLNASKEKVDRDILKLESGNRDVTLKALKQERGTSLQQTSFTGDRNEDAKRKVTGNPFNREERAKELQDVIDAQKTYKAGLERLRNDTRTTVDDQIAASKELAKVDEELTAAMAEQAHIAGGLAYQMQLALDPRSLMNKIEGLDGGFENLGNTLQNNVVTAIDDAGQAFANLVVEGESFGTAVNDIFRKMLQRLAMDFAQQGFNQLVGGAIQLGTQLVGSMFTGSPGPDGGSVLNSGGGGFSSQNSLQGLAEGGIIRGKGTGTSDEILGMIRETGEPIMVSNGESILTAKATSMMGADLINAINKGKVSISRYAQGGIIGRVGDRHTNSTTNQTTSYEANISIPVTTQGGQQGSGIDPANLAKLDKMIAKNVRDTIANETRQGGLLNRR